MRSTLILTLCAMLAPMPACAQPAPADGVHATPEQPAEPGVRSWRRVFPEGEEGEGLRTLFAVVAGEHAIDDAFSQAFYEHTTREQLERVIAEVREASGGGFAFVRVLRTSGRALGVELVDAEGEPWTVAMTIDDDGIASLQLTPQPERDADAKVYDTWGEVLADVRALEGDVSFAVRRIGAAGVHTPLALHEDDRTLNVAQLGQLYVLGAAAQGVASGMLAWDDEIAMREAFRSLPPSQYALAEDGAVHTLGEYAVGAGALRDSAASDAVLHAVGRDAVRAYYESIVDDPPAHAFPWLSMRDYALLKLFSSQAGRERYASGNEDARLATLEGVPDDADLSVDRAARIASWREPREVGRIGWFASADDVVRTLVDLTTRASAGEPMRPLERALLAKASAPLSSVAWPVQVYKRAGEPGAFALATLLRRYDGVSYTLVLILNDEEHNPDVEEAQRIALGAIDLLTLED